MGAADVVPGVSGGTMALILGIYQRLIDAIKSFDLVWLQSFFRLDLGQVLQRPHLAFIIPLFLGIGSALIFFTRIVPLPVYIRTHPEYVYGLFFGLILGSILVLIIDLKKPALQDLVAIFFGTISGLYVFNLVPATTPDDAWFIFISGAVAISAMILPGISGSFILLMMKKYAYIMDGIGHLNLMIILPFGLGVVVGLILFSRVLSWLLARYYKPTLLFIIGLLVASLSVIWPFQQRSYTSVRGKEYLIDSTAYLPDSFSSVVLVSTLLIGVGFLIVVFVHWLAHRKRA